jgi:hypothetical protein
MSKVLSVLVLSLAATSAANAFERTPPWAQHQAANHQTNRDAPRANATDPADPPAEAPEIDPASAMSALTLLAGALAVVRGRRSSRRRKE